MSSQRHTPGYLPVKMNNKTVLELKPERMVNLRERVLLGDYDDLKKQLPELQANNLQTRFARHENSVLETALLAAIEYCEERKQKNANEKTAFELQERDLAAEVETISNRINDARQEAGSLESKMSDYLISMGRQYLEKKRGIIEALTGIAQDSALEGATGVGIAVHGLDRKKILDAIMNSLESTEIIQGDGFMAIKLDGAGAMDLMDELAKSAGADGLPPNLSAAGNLDSDEGYGEMARRKFAGMIRNTVEMAAEESVSLLKVFPDILARREITDCGGDCSWLDSLDAETASKADPAAVRNAAKELRRMRADLIESAKILKSASHTLNSQRNETESNCNYLEKALDADSVKPGMEDSALKYIESMRALIPGMKSAIAKLEKVQRISLEMADLMRTYQKALTEYPETCRRLIACQKKAEVSPEHAQIIEKHRLLLDKIRAKDIRMSELAVLHRALKDEYAAMENARMKKIMHVQNSPRNDMRKSLEEKPAFVFVKQEALGECEGQRVAKIERALDLLAERALECYPDFRKCHSKQRKNFESTIKELGRIYLENGCKLGPQNILDAPKFGKKARHEPTYVRPNCGLKLVRLGIESTVKYRLIIDLSRPESPAILFAGIKDGCDRFLNDAGYEHAANRAESDGRRTLFHVLKNL